QPVDPAPQPQKIPSTCPRRRRRPHTPGVPAAGEAPQVPGPMRRRGPVERECPRGEKPGSPEGLEPSARRRLSLAGGGRTGCDPSPGREGPPGVPAEEPGTQPACVNRPGGAHAPTPKTH